MGEYRMLEKLLAEKDYLPITVMADGSMATRNNWGERRAEMISLLEEYSYGQTPQVPVRVKGISNGFGKYTCAGKCTEEFVDVVYTTPRGEGVIPIQVYAPVSVDSPSVLLHLAFGKAPHMYIPVEEIIDHGYALVVVDYQDMVNDNHFGDYSDGIADHFATTNKRKNNEWGKIGMWAWAGSRSQRSQGCRPNVPDGWRRKPGMQSDQPGRSCQRWSAGQRASGR